MMAVTVTNDTAGALAFEKLNKNTNDVRLGTDMKNDSLGGGLLTTLIGNRL